MTAGYILRRLGFVVAVVVFATTVNFFIPRLSPVNPITSRLYELAAQGGVNIGKLDEMIASYETKFGLDLPLWKQYLNYWGDLIRLDLGVSFANYADVKTEILRALPWTIGLLTVTTLIGFFAGSAIGALLAWGRKSRVFLMAAPLLMAMSAIPFYLLGILLVFLLAMTWPILPTAGGISYAVDVGLTWAAIGSIFKHAILPGLAIAVSSIGFWALGMRGMMVTTMGEDYVKFATVKGLRPRRIFLDYGIRNAMLPQITALAIQLGFIMSGAVLVEVIFAYPGVGYLLFEAIGRNDFFMIQGIVFFIILGIASALFVMDLIYPLLDPRIRR